MAAKASEEFRGVSIENALAEVLHNVEVVAFGADQLKHHPGRGLTVLATGSFRLMSHPVVQANAEKQDELMQALRALYARAERLCESPIERNLLAGLLSGCWGFSRSALPLLHNPNDKDETFPPGDVVIAPQFQFGRHRLDFAVIVAKGKAKRIFALECDGAEFHDRDKDYRRDVYLAAFGVTTLRFTGTDLFTRPIEVSDRIINAISGWVAE